MKKYIGIMMMFLTVFLVACAPSNNEEPIIPIDEAKVAFEERLLFLEDNNYDLEIVILDHSTLSETKAMMSFDGNVSKFVDGSYEAYYSVNGNTVTMLEKQGDEYISKSASSLESGLFYYGFEYEMFSKITDDKYVLKQSAYESLDSFKVFDDSVTSLSNVSIDFDASNLVKVTFDIMLNETTYLVTLNISNVGQVDLVLPA